MSTRSLLSLLSASLLTPLLVAVPSGEAIAQDALVEVRHVQIRSRNDLETYAMTVSTPGPGASAVNHVDVQFLESFGGPDPFEDSINITDGVRGFELLAPNAGEPIEVGLSYELSLTPLADDGSPTGDSVFLDPLQLGGGISLVAGELSFSPDHNFFVRSISVVDSADCFDCIALELEPAPGTPDDAVPGAVQIQGESVASASASSSLSASDSLSAGPSAAPPRTVEALTESAVATYFWSFEPIQFYESPLDEVYLLNVELRDIDGQLATTPVEVEVIVEAGDDVVDPGPIPTVIIDGTHDGDLDLGPDDVALISGTVNGRITNSGGFVILSGSTVSGDIEMDSGTLQVSDHVSLGNLVLAGDVTITGEVDQPGGDFAGDLIVTGGSVTFTDHSVLTFDESDITVNSFTIGGGNLTFINDSQITVDGGNITVGGDSSWNVGGSSTIVITGGNVEFGGNSTVDILSESTLDVSGGGIVLFTDFSTVTLSGDSTIDVFGGGNLEILREAHLTIDGDSNIVARGGGSVRFASDTSLTTSLDFFLIGGQGSDATLDGTLTAGQTLEVRMRGDGGTLTVNGTVTSGGDLDLRTTGDNSPLTLDAELTAGGNLDLKTRGDNSRLRVAGGNLQIDPGTPAISDVLAFARTNGDNSPLTIDAEVDVPGDLDVRTRGDGSTLTLTGHVSTGGELFAKTRGALSDLVVEKGLSFGMDVDANVDFRVTGHDAGITMLDSLAVNGFMDLRVTGGGDINVHDSLTVGADLFARTRNGGSWNAPCDLAVEQGICLFGGSITVNSDDAININGAVSTNTLDLDAGGSLDVDGTVNAGDMYAYGGGYRPASYTRIGNLCVLSGLARIDGGGGDTVIDGSIDALGDVIITSGGSTSINGSLEADSGPVLVSAGDISLDSDTTVDISGQVAAESGSIEVFADEGTTLTEGSSLDWQDFWAEVTAPTDLDPGSWTFDGDTPQYRRRRRGRRENSDIVTINIYDGNRD
jgi:hypothetical protein